MADSKPGPAPPQGGDGPPESRLADDFRRRRAVPLVPAVRRVAGGIRVGSSCRDMCYLVSAVDGRAQCTCPGYQLHEVRDNYQCKHILAVEIARRSATFRSLRMSRPSPQRGRLPSSNTTCRAKIRCAFA